ncbi:MAG TPA: maleylpyruvate isomerase family mycothiol-dependent enzyme [Acidimicrobiales bacterium]|nr:maleylpyruvate isomerase family mycothiol-dependent enzyme [Acidimicrobiales bacterium]
MDFLDAIRRESDRFYRAADAADPARSVPTCPGWTVADLVWHLGQVHFFWATVIEQRLDDPAPAEAATPPRPADYRDLIAFGRAQAGHLIDALRATPDDVAVWTWALDEAAHTVGFIRRHQVQEAAVHRWDLENAAATPAPIDADVASDSIDELLAVTLPWCVRPDNPLPGTVHLHCTDTDGEWFVDATGEVTRTHAKADVAVRGAASDILLTLFKRVTTDAVELVGDANVAHRFVEMMNTD